MNRLQRRDLVPAIILTLVTCGLYGIYWTYVLGEETHQIDENLPDGKKLLIYTFFSCSFYIIYWMYQAGDAIGAAKPRIIPGAKAEQNGVFYAILSCAGFAIAAFALLQKDMNEIADAMANDANAGNPNQWV